VGPAGDPRPGSVAGLVDVRPLARLVLLRLASRAIRTLKGMLDDDDPALAREARRLLRELDVRGAEE